MHYFKHHIGDYDAATTHLSWLEDMAFTRLIRIYYRDESPIPADLAKACRLVRAISKQEKEAVAVVLDEFFVLKEDGWHNKRCSLEILAYHSKASTNRNNGKGGGRPPKIKTGEKPSGLSVGSGSADCGNPQETLTTNQEPLTTNHNPLKPPKGGCVEHPLFAQIWSQYPRRPGASRTDALKAFTARINEGIAPESMLSGVVAYAAYCQKAVSDPKHIKQAATFLGPSKHFESDWTYAQPAGASHAKHQKPDNSVPAQIERAIAERNARRQAQSAGPSSGDFIEGEFERAAF
jgi:uncharacterized protein YdaU (DUF1376 family)